ncbi:unnamed protein product [Lactuca saligna]|uniref:Uncharacterized protein n=1 Tax=Lactuca saligna TaxID=75948 RepID=A0AA35UU83_LACSI|nr:unnamed protein product [Lactuca saligna]
MSSHWSILTDNDGEQFGKLEQHPCPRGRRNMRGSVMRGQSVQQNVPMGGGSFCVEMMAGYFDRMSLSMNWIGGTMENMIQHFNINQPPNMGNQYPIFPSWGEYWSRQGDEAGTSGARDDEDEE